MYDVVVNTQDSVKKGGVLFRELLFSRHRRKAVGQAAPISAFYFFLFTGLRIPINREYGFSLMAFAYLLIWAYTIINYSTSNIEITKKIGELSNNGLISGILELGEKLHSETKLSPEVSRSLQELRNQEGNKDSQISSEKSLLLSNNTRYDYVNQLFRATQKTNVKMHFITGLGQMLYRLTYTIIAHVSASFIAINLAGAYWDDFNSTEFFGLRVSLLALDGVIALINCMISGYNLLFSPEDMEHEQLEEIYKFLIKLNPEENGTNVLLRANQNNSV